jgi:hypothetical protein
MFLISGCYFTNQKLSRHLRKKAFCVSDEDGDSSSDYYVSTALISPVFARGEWVLSYLFR